MTQYLWCYRHISGDKDGYTVVPNNHKPEQFFACDFGNIIMYGGSMLAMHSTSRRHASLRSINEKRYALHLNRVASILASLESDIVRPRQHRLLPITRNIYVIERTLSICFRANIQMMRKAVYRVKEWWASCQTWYLSSTNKNGIILAHTQLLRYQYMKWSICSTNYPHILRTDKQY